MTSRWPFVRIREVADVVRGASPRPAGDPRYFNGNDLPWITVADVTRRPGVYLEHTQSMLTSEGSKFTRILDPNTLILTNSGATLGVPKITRVRAGANDGIAALVNLRRVNPLFLYYCLERQTRWLREHLAPGVGQPNLNTGLIGALEIPLPTESDQVRISGLLNWFDEELSQLQSLQLRKRQFKRGLMQRLLASATSASPSPAGWRDHKLGELLCQRVETGRPDLPLLAVTAGRGVVPRDHLDRRDSSNPDKSVYLRVAPGDIVYNTMRMWQGVSARSSLEGIVSPAYTVCVPGPALDSEFAAVLFKHKPIVHLFHRHSQGLVKDTLNLKFDRLASIRVRVPDIGTQRSIAALFREIDTELALLEQLATALDRQKRALLDKLLSGELRLPPV